MSPRFDAAGMPRLADLADGDCHLKMRATVDHLQTATRKRPLQKIGKNVALIFSLGAPYDIYLRTIGSSYKYEIRT
jgi:hypothetical protein